MKKKFISSLVLITQFGISQNATPLPAKVNNEPQESVLKMNGQIVGQKNAEVTSVNAEAIPLPATRRETPDTTLQLIITFPDSEKKFEPKKTEPKSSPR